MTAHGEGGRGGTLTLGSLSRASSAARPGPPSPELGGDGLGARLVAQ